MKYNATDGIIGILPSCNQKMTDTLFFLMAQFGPRAVIPLDEVRKEYFSHLEPHVFIRKLAHGEIPLPLLRIEQVKNQRKEFI